MISGGAAFLSALAMLILGVFIGAAISEHYHRNDIPGDEPTSVGPEWGEIDRAATAAYERMSRDPEVQAALDELKQPYDQGIDPIPTDKL